MKPIVNLADVTCERVAHGEKFEVADGSVSTRIGAKQLGCSLMVVPKGKRAYPYHCHHVNEEMFVILSGTGILRFGGDEHPVKERDVISTPAGGRETAHQLVNTGDGELRYLAISTMVPMEVVEYPDSNKVGVYVGSAPGESAEKRTMNFRGKLGPQLEYWDGE
jgi:uncharacterized cupin superfamily protein